MTENSNPSYETLIKRLQQIYQQSQSNKESIQNSQPDNSKIYLDNNWLQNIAIVDDTRSDDGTDQPVQPIASTTIVQDITSVYTSFIPITYNITSGLMPMTVSYTYQEILPNITKDIIPFLEYQTTFSAPTGNMSLAAGFVWNVDAWVNDYTIIANGVSVWDGPNAPFASSIEISQVDVDNNYPGFYQQSWGLSFTSPEGGIYGSGATVGVILLSIYDSTASIVIPITTDVVSTLNPVHTYQFFTWSNTDEFTITFESSLMNFSSIVVTEHTGAYIALWPDAVNPFYIYEDFISAGDVSLDLFPPTGSNQDLSPITFTINADGALKYSDILGQFYSVYVNAPPSYDPFYIRQSKSTDTIDSWQANVTFGAIATTQGVQTTGQVLPKYNDVYTGTTPPAGLTTWTPSYNHTTIEGDQYLPTEYDMTTRVRVVVRPIVNWKKTDKYQV